MRYCLSSGLRLGAVAYLLGTGNLVLVDQLDSQKVFRE